MPTNPIALTLALKSLAALAIIIYAAIPWPAAAARSTTTMTTD